MLKTMKLFDLRKRRSRSLYWMIAEEKIEFLVLVNDIFTLLIALWDDSLIGITP